MEIIHENQIYGLIQRTLNHVDTRLIDHGKRVSYLVSKMLEEDGMEAVEVKKFCFLALLHDIGAYKTEEIDSMVQFETQNVWEHSIYGYLFIRNLSPLKQYAPVILFHHTDYAALQKISTDHKKTAQIFNVADRVDIFLQNNTQDQDALTDYLLRESGTRFDPKVVSLFLQTDKKQQLYENLKKPVDFPSILGEFRLTPDEIDIYLKMIIYFIDFRSHHTVTHTITTTQISLQLAKRLDFTPKQQKNIFYGSLLHDLGKIGIPVEILEYPGKLSSQAMNIMRTHVDITEEILGGFVDGESTRIALRHHEKLDGSGYPRGLTAPELTLAERIVAVADIVSALCGTRSYKEAFPKEKTLSIITQMEQDGKLDSTVVHCMTEAFDAVMKEVYKSCEPVLRVYEQIHTEYLELLQIYGS
jgi:HD-GYP domain-containing protein (c-di-GMP phosphodiesterase class II)